MCIERQNSPIILDEWLRYINTDSELELAETGTVINPLTKKAMKMSTSGRAILHGTIELFYRDGRIICEDGSEDTAVKLKQIAATLSAELIE